MEVAPCYLRSLDDQSEDFFEEIFEENVLQEAKVFPIAKGGKKICSNCKNPFEASAKFFYRNKYRRDGFDSSCKLCRRIYFRDLHLKKAYGIDSQDFEAMRRNQGNRCKCCGRKFNSRPVIHHDHKTGKVIGLLHNNCNTILGLCHENPETLDRAAAFLREYNKL